ncbi:BTAD domain-containing putative transcriptional regulator [Thermus sp. FJN-A]
MPPRDWAVPAVPPGYLPRPRVDTLLDRGLGAPVLVVRAEAGYGKTLAVAAWVRARGYPTAWLSLSTRTGEEVVLEQEIRRGLRLLLPVSAPEESLESLLEALLHLEGTFLFVLDDVHTVTSPSASLALARLAESLPPNLHLVLISRGAPSLPNRPRLRVYGEWREVTRQDLAFTAEEVEALFLREGIRLRPEEAALLAQETEGWPAALRLIAEKAKDGWPVAELLRRGQDSLEDLFTYLAVEVLAKEAEEVRTFLLHTAILERLEPPVCQALVPGVDAQALLRELEGRSLFLTPHPEGSYRFHTLFQRFLRTQASARLGDLSALHAQAASAYLAQGRVAEAIPHLLAAGRFPEVQSLLEVHGENLNAQGLYPEVASWCDALPPPLLWENPRLLRLRGEAARLLSDFRAALQWCHMARSQAQGEEALWAARALAQIYLDTVQPSQAEAFLQEALRYCRSHPRLRPLRTLFLRMLAENEVNRGRLRRAERLYRVLGLPPDPRLRLRQGRFSETRSLLEGWERFPSPRTPGVHREPALVLAWAAALSGDQEEALRYAHTGLRLAQDLRSPIMECVAWARLGHAWLTGEHPNPARAREAYEQSLTLSQAIAVPRFAVEAHLGLGLLEGYAGRMDRAEGHFGKALAILQEAGDEYMQALLTLARGIALAENGLHQQAEEAFTRAICGGESCGEHYLSAAANLWLAWLAQERGDHRAFLESIRAFLQRLKALRDLECLLLEAPSLGLKRAERRLRLLRLALGNGLEEASPYVLRLLRLHPCLVGLLPPTVLPHDRGRIFIQTLGRFRIWRGMEEIPREAFGRSKALQLLQLLVAQRNHALPKEAVLEALWPGKPPEEASPLLRVLLFWLDRALDPEKPGNLPSRIVLREKETLWLNRERVNTDVDLFEALLAEGKSLLPTDPQKGVSQLRQALALYQGEFLADLPYAEWAIPERERLLLEFVEAVVLVADHFLRWEQPGEAIAIAHRLLEVDPMAEEAYRILLRGYGLEGRIHLALRAYNRYSKILGEIGVTPEPFEALLAGEGKNGKQTTTGG